MRGAIPPLPPHVFMAYLYLLFIIKLSSHLPLGLPLGLFRFSDQNFICFLISPMHFNSSTRNNSTYFNQGFQNKCLKSSHNFHIEIVHLLTSKYKVSTSIRLCVPVVRVLNVTQTIRLPDSVKVFEWVKVLDTWMACTGHVVHTAERGDSRMS
jgi:hypothetical protein